MTTPHYTLHSYQARAIEHLREHPRAALFLDMGLGKTAIVLRALQPRHIPALVVAPGVVAGTAASRREKLRRYLADGTDIVVISRDNMADAEPCAKHFRTLVLDELSSFKNHAAKRTQSAVALSGKIKHVWGLTGTPARNGFMGLWAQLNLLDRGERLGKNITAYRRDFFYSEKRTSTGVPYDWKLRPGARERIMSSLDDICISMSKEEYLSLPPATINRVLVPMPSKVKHFYSKLKEDNVASLDILGEIDDAGIRSATTAAAVVSKLAQVTAGFIFDDAENYPDGRPDDAYTRLHNAKTDAVVEIVEGTGSPVLVFYRFRPERFAIKAALGPDAMCVDEPGAIEAWNAGDLRALIAHPASAGHGLNLQHQGHTIVWSSPSYDLELWKQANARLHRQGQQHPVMIHVLIGQISQQAPYSIDTLVMQALQGKVRLEKALLDYLRA